MSGLTGLFASEAPRKLLRAQGIHVLNHRARGRRAPFGFKETAMTNRTRKAKPKSYVLLGHDQFARPRGARFSDEDPELLVKTAEAMHLWLIEVTGRGLAKKRRPICRSVGCMRAGMSSSRTSRMTCMATRSARLSTMFPRRHRTLLPPRKTCRAAGTTLRRATSSSRGRRSNAVGTKRW